MVEKYWNNLSENERIDLLEKHDYWLGFSHYIYEYLPNDLKNLLGKYLS